MLVALGIVVLFGVAFGLAVRRFARRRRLEGKWNAEGPIEPTYGEPDPALRAVGIHPPTIGEE